LSTILTPSNVVIIATPNINDGISGTDGVGVSTFEVGLVVGMGVDEVCEFEVGFDVGLTVGFADGVGVEMVGVGVARVSPVSVMWFVLPSCARMVTEVWVLLEVIVELSIVCPSSWATQVSGLMSNLGTVRVYIPLEPEEPAE
jgi:hypothetical protein